MFKYILVTLIISINIFSSTINYDEYFKNNKNVMLFIDPNNGKIIKANKSASKFYGYSIKDLEKMQIHDFNTFTKEQVKQEMKNAKIAQRNYFLFSHKIADDTIKKVRIFSSPIKVDGKTLLYSTIYPLELEKEFLDHFNKTLEEQVQLQIAEIKQSEEKIKQIYLIGFLGLSFALIITIALLIQRNKLAKQLSISNKRFSLAMESTKDGLWDWNPKTDKVYFNLTLKTMLGYTASEFENNFKAWYSKLHPEDYDRVLKDLNTHVEGKTPVYESIYRLQHKDGSWVWILARGKALFGEDGNAIRVIGFHTDITKQKNIEKELLEQKEEYESIFNYAQDGIAIIDLEYNFLNCNQAFLDITGYSKEEILSKNYNELTDNGSKEKSLKALKDAEKSNHVENIEKSFIVANDRRITVNISASLLPDKKRLLLLIHDTTVLKIMEQQSKLASMGEMIGNIAHQWRQPLSVISTAASSIDLKLSYEKEVDKNYIQKTTKNIVDQTQYLSKTIDDFKNFVKGDKENTNLSLKETIKDVINLTKATIDNNYINLVVNIEDDITIYGNKNELEQAFINIINNAKDSLKEHVKEDENKHLFIDAKKTDKDSLVIEILDSGGGIPNDIINRIFEPYFTTKHQSLGTGIGLSMVDNILRERHEAQLKVFNKEFEYKGKKYMGASFNIIFTNKNL